MKKLLVLIFFLSFLCGTVRAANITATHLTTALNTTDLSEYTTASITPSSNKLVLLTVMGRRTAGASVAPTVSGNGLTWVEIASSAYASIATPLRRVTVFRAMGVSPSAGVVTITFADTQNDCEWTITEFGNVDTGGANGADAIVQSVSDNVDTQSTSWSITLAAFSDVNNATFGGFASNSSTSRTAGSGFTILDDSNTSTFAEWKTTNDTSVDFSFVTGGIFIGGVAIEIKNATQSGSSAGARGHRLGFAF